MDNFERWHFEAQIGHHASWFSYLGSYQHAIEVLFTEIAENRLPVNTIAYPLLFLIRHSLELGYKANIKYFSKYSGLNEMVDMNKHYLRELHHSFKNHFYGIVNDLNVDEIFKNQFEEYCSDVEKLSNIFDVLDRGSFSFRYPTDTKQKIVFEHAESINLMDVYELHKNSMILLFHTVDVLSDYFDLYDEYQNEFM